MEYGATKLNLASVIEHHARIAPAKEAVVWNEMRLTYGQLNALSNRVANALAEMGIEKGDKVALSCPNLPFFPIVYYGILKAGAVVVPLSVLFKPREVAYHLADSDAKAVFVFEGTEELPMAKCVKEGFDQVDSCRDLIVMTKDPTAPPPFDDCQTLTAITAGKSEDFRNRFDCAARHLRDSLHFRHDRTAEGRGADASESDHECNDDLRHSPARAGFYRRRAEKLSDHPAAFSHDRADRPDEYEYVWRKPDDPAAAFRTVGDARDDGTRKGKFLGRRSDDVLGDLEIRRGNRL